MVKMSERRAERRAHLDSKPKPIPETNERSLRQAAALGDMEKLQQLLKADGVDVNDRDVTAASHYPHRSIARRAALTCVAHLPQDASFTALMLAAMRGHAEAVKALLAAGADKSLMTIIPDFGEAVEAQMIEHDVKPTPSENAFNYATRYGHPERKDACRRRCDGLAS